MLDERLMDDLWNVLNRYDAGYDSNTNNKILAEYALACIEAFNLSINKNKKLFESCGKAKADIKTTFILNPPTIDSVTLHELAIKLYPYFKKLESWGH